MPIIASKVPGHARLLHRQSLNLRNIFFEKKKKCNKIFKQKKQIIYLLI